MPHHCPRCTGKHLPEPAWHCEYEDALWTPLISSPCHLGSGPPPLLPECPRLREMASHLAPVSLSPKLGSFCSLILLATIILYRDSKEKKSPLSSIHPPTHLSKHSFMETFIHISIYLTMHLFIHLSTNPSTFPPIHSSIYPFIHLTICFPYIYPSICPFISPPICPIYSLIHAHIHKYIHLFINLFILPSLHPFIYHPSTDIFILMEYLSIHLLSNLIHSSTHFSYSII